MLTTNAIAPSIQAPDSKREIVRLNDVCKYYGQADTLVKALDDVSFVIKEGDDDLFITDSSCTTITVCLS